jgi:hypothetical protein
MANNNRLKERIESLEEEKMELKRELQLIEKQRIESLMKMTSSSSSSSTATHQPHSSSCSSSTSSSSLAVSNPCMTSNSHSASSSNNEINNLEANLKMSTHMNNGRITRPANTNNISCSSTSSLDSFGSNESWRKQQQQQQQNNPNLHQQRLSNAYMHLSHGPTNNASKSVKFKLDGMPSSLPSQQESENGEDDDQEIRSSYSSHQEHSPPPPTLVEYVASYISKRKLKVIDTKAYEDGHVDKLLEDGTTVTMFPNGTIKETEPNRQRVFVKFFNGDYKELNHATNSETYFYAETNITQIIDLKSGLQMLKFPSGQVEKFHADKTREIIFPDKLVKIMRPDGTEETRLPNGTSIRVEANGDKVIEYPNRQREIHTKDFKRREYPDGSVKTVYTNGISETKYSNGRVRLKDSMGNIISDSKAT